MTRFLVAGMVGVAVCAGLVAMLMGTQPGQPLAARNDRTAERQEIREKPLVERPNRPGHFYGNTVRRMYQSPFSRN